MAFEADDLQDVGGTQVQAALSYRVATDLAGLGTPLTITGVQMMDRDIGRIGSSVLELERTNRGT